MQEPPEDDEAPIPMETVSNGPNETLNRTFKERRKAANRTLPWDLPVDELDLISPLQGEDIRARKKQRLEEESFPPTTDEADSQPNAGATRATGSWTLEEDAMLTRAVANTPKKKRGREHKTDWIGISVLVLGRTRKQCWQRWKDIFVDRANASKGNWTADEDSKLKDAVQMHGGKNWGAISAMVPDRTKRQCNDRWKLILDPSIDRSNASKGKWTADEDSKLLDAVQMHGGKSWAAISALVPGRTKRQCNSRWRAALDPSITDTAERTGRWISDEDSKLKDAVQMHGGKNWPGIAALIPGRTRQQCNYRWNDVLVDRANARKGKWTADEDSKLKDAVQTHGDKDWVALSALVPGRTRRQCLSRWKAILDPSIDRANASKGK
jgi:hypothetical protein